MDDQALLADRLRVAPSLRIDEKIEPFRPYPYGEQRKSWGGLDEGQNLNCFLLILPLSIGLRFTPRN